MKLDGKVALVTGGGSGIGEAICLALASEGAHVAVVDINREAAELAAGVVAKGHPIVADVSDSSAVDRAIAEAEAALGPLDILVNNAGIAGQEMIDRVAPRMEQQLSEMATSGTVTTVLDATVELGDEE